jgi:hypothetical protein
MKKKNRGNKKSCQKNDVINVLSDILPRNGRRIQCLKALDLMLGTNSSSSM